MENAMDAALEHAKSRAMYLNKCSSTYIIHISIKELGLPSSMEGAFFINSLYHQRADSATEPALFYKYFAGCSFWRSLLL